MPKRAIKKSRARASDVATIARPSRDALYNAGSRTLPQGAGYAPPLRDPNTDIASAWDQVGARATDLMHNMGWVAGGIEQGVANAVGTGLRLNAMPDAEALALDSKGAATWARDVERKFARWAHNAYECDIEGRRTLGQMESAGYKGYYAMGEMVATFPLKARGNGYQTKIRMVPAFRLARKTLDGERLIQGVRMDADGLPISYVFNVPDPYLGNREVEITARDSFTRRKVLHAYDGDLGTVRGISPLAPVLIVAKQFDSLQNATLTSAIVQSIFAASLTSEAPTEEAMAGMFTPVEIAELKSKGQTMMDGYFQMMAGWYQGNPLNIGMNGRIASLLPSQELKFHTSEAPNSSYKDFAIMLLREMSRCAGMTYESWTGDYAGVTFSSIRMATDEIWRVVTRRRKFVVSPLPQAAFECWLEEAIDRGDVPLKGGIDRFFEYKCAICAAEWKGSPKPVPDEQKQADTHKTYYAMRVISATQIADETGRDIDDVYAELESEQEKRKEHKIEDPILTASAPAQPTPPGDHAGNAAPKPKEGAPAK